MVSSLCTLGSCKLPLLCIAIAVASHTLQGCSQDDKSGSMPEAARAAALVQLNNAKTKCGEKCKDKCNYKEQDFDKHMEEFEACHSCLDTSCKEEFKKVYNTVDQHWYEPVCMAATQDAEKCWQDGSTCFKLMDEFHSECVKNQTKGCDIKEFTKIDQCWIDHTHNCMDRYLPCFTKDGANASTNYCDNMPSFGDFFDPFGPGFPLDPGMPVPVLTDADCKNRYYGLNYSYTFEGGSEIKNGCCKLKSMQKCTIITFPEEAGAIDAGKTFDCKAKSS